MNYGVISSPPSPHNTNYVITSTIEYELIVPTTPPALTISIPAISSNNVTASRLFSRFKMGSNSTVAAGPRAIPVINQPLQALLLSLILLAAIVTNGSVILNISRDPLKLRMVHFLLIRHVCITDTVGAVFVLPIPLVSFIKGYWDWTGTSCTVISTTTACCWTMHLVAVALYRADRVLAVWLPTGKYPILSAKLVNGLLVLVWAVVLSGSYLATYAFTPTFQPALALCIPNVPLIFFILVFTLYCLGLATLTTGYVLTFIRRRRKRRRRKRMLSSLQLPPPPLHPTPTLLQQSTSKSAPNLPTSNKSSASSITSSHNPPPPNPPNSNIPN